MRALCYAQTNIGSGRDNNEDNYYCNGTFKRDPAIPVAEAAAEQESKRLIYGVFDGMGGAAVDLRQKKYLFFRRFRSRGKGGRRR